MHNICIFNGPALMTLDDAILQLIGEDSIGDQATLRERLHAAGHAVTQPTLSRRLKRLGVRKIRGAYHLAEQSVDLVPDYELTLSAPNLVILKTKPGHAQVIAVLLDAENLPGTAGCVAGDDTIFIAARPDQDLDGLAERIHAALA